MLKPRSQTGFLHNQLSKFTVSSTSMHGVNCACSMMISITFAGQYLSLDVDHNGMLSKSELARLLLIVRMYLFSFLLLDLLLGH